MSKTNLSTKKCLAVIKAALKTFMEGDFDETKLDNTRYLNKHFMEKCKENFDEFYTPKPKKVETPVEEKVVEESTEEKSVEETTEEVKEEVVEETSEEKTVEETTEEKTVEEPVEEVKETTLTVEEPALDEKVVKKMKVKELKDLCKERGLEVSKEMKKKDLVELLMA